MSILGQTGIPPRSVRISSSAVSSILNRTTPPSSRRDRLFGPMPSPQQSCTQTVPTAGIPRSPPDRRLHPTALTPLLATLPHGGIGDLRPDFPWADRQNYWGPNLLGQDLCGVRWAETKRAGLDKVKHGFIILV